MPAMDTNIQAEPSPGDELLKAVAETEPENPFHTPTFARARALRGEIAVAFLAARDADKNGCTGFVTHGRIHRNLTVISAPAIAQDHPLWGAIREFCGRAGITRLRIQSFGSKASNIPSLGRELSRTRRREFVLDLGPERPPLTLSSNHKRNLRRAERAGIQVCETSEPEASQAHAALIDESMARRQERGEQVSSDTPLDIARYFLEMEAATLFQASAPQGHILSSMLVLLSARGAYYHSAGTSPDGMRAGASQLLLATVAERLRDRGITRFNLGGAAEEQSGLERFKLGFRPQTIELETATFDVARGHRRVTSAVAEGLHTALGRWRRT